MKKTALPNSLAPFALESVLVVTGAVLTAFLFFWPQFRHGFTHLYGDPYDGTIEAVLISHWYSVLRGLQHWNEPLYFYPHHDVLGYNDGYLIFGLIGAIFRSFGADVLRAAEYTHVTVKLIGFFSMYALCRRFGNKPFINAAIAIVFSIAINSENGQHMQLLAVSFAPAMVLLGLSALNSLEKGLAARFAILSVIWAVLFGAWLMTGYYMAFFFGLFVLFFIGACALTSLETIKNYAVRVKQHPYVVALFVLAFVASTVPFLMVYLPKLKETSGQPLEVVKTYAQYPIDLLNIGTGSALWGRLYDLVNQSVTPALFRAGEHVAGFQPIFLIAFLIAGCVLVRSWKSGNAPDRLTLALFLAALALILCVMDFGGKTLWVAIYRLVPGGKGVRVISRFFIFLVFPMSVVIACWMHRASRRSAALLAIILPLMIVEQINLAPSVNLAVAPQLAALDRIPPVPADCKVIYGKNPTPYTSWSREAVAMYVNIQTMLIADHVNRPTINGVATFLPQGWIFNGWPAETYVSRLVTFAKSNNIDGLCGYDITEGKWVIETGDSPVTLIRVLQK